METMCQRASGTGPEGLPPLRPGEARDGPSSLALSLPLLALVLVLVLVLVHNSFPFLDLVLLFALCL